MNIILYNLLFFLMILMGFPILLPLALCSEKRRKTVLGRLGLILPPVPPKGSNARIWVHALSVGEVISALPLVKALKSAFPDREILFSASTLTGFQMAEEQLKQHVLFVFYFPYDLIFSIKRILRRIDPDAAVIVETDIWPNFLAETARRGVPVFLANARLSKRSLSGYRRAAFFIRPVFQCFAKICCQSALDADRFQRLGLPLELIPVTGSIKFDQTRESFPKSRLEEIRKTAGIPAGRKVMVAGSTHEGEEAVLAEALTLLKREFPDLCLIAAPRDPLRARAVRQVFQQAGFSGVLMSEPERCSDPDVIIIDRIGVLNGLYAFADAAFVGGSLIRLGGHNPLEPAAWGRPILFGPYMSDFVEISHLLLESGGAEEVTDASSLYGAVKAILMGREKAEHMGSQALRVFQANKGAVERTVGIIQDYLRQDYLRQDYLRK